jgi:hypothetical protein
MLIGALGAAAISQIANALAPQSQARVRTPDRPTADSASSQPLTASEPPNRESAISKAAAKLVTELKSLLLNVQAEQSQSNPGTPHGGRQTVIPAASGVPSP